MSEQPKPNPRLDLDAIRAKLAGKQGKTYWRSLEEVAETPEFEAWLADEFPNRREIADIDRRSLLKFMGASLALAGLSGCRGYFMPEEKIVPYVTQPEEMVIGKPLYYATAFSHAGFGYGVLVKQNEGRPTKIEGNPDHPANRGTTSTFMQASILTMYDPDRAQTVMNAGQLSTWEEFLKAARKALKAQKNLAHRDGSLNIGSGGPNAGAGTGFRILTGAVTSPTMLVQLAELKAEFPGMDWHAYEPFGQDNAHAGTKMAFGQPMNVVYDFAKAKVVVSLDSNFLQESPGSLRYARDFMDARRVQDGKVEMNRLYAIEATPTITGAMADHRWGVRPSQVLAAANAIHAGLNGGVVAKVDGISAEALGAIIKDLQANHGAAVVVPGEFAPAEVHAVAAAINEALKAPLVLTAPVDGSVAAKPISELVTALKSNHVEVLMIVGGNPVYDAPADLQFGENLRRAKVKIRYGYYVDETSALCDWHLPATHFLEEWSDTRAYDGTASLVQPLTTPLFEGKSIHEVIDALLGRPYSGIERVQATWKKAGLGGADFDKVWRECLHQGIIPNSALPPVASRVTAGFAPPQAKSATGMEIAFRPDVQLFDGRYANNGWLMEVPRPLTMITWDNAVHLSPRTAKQLNVVSEDKVRITSRGVKIEEAVVWVLPGQPDNVVTLHAGYGRTKGGTIATDAGFDIYPLRTSEAPLYDAGITIEPIGGIWPIASTQIHHAMEGRDIVRFGTISEFKNSPTLRYSETEPKLLTPEEQKKEEEEIRDKNMYPDEIFGKDNMAQWGMTIDLHTCIGCNACAVACQAENNIPVVGKDQVKRGREMHWLRIDRYYTTHDASTEAEIRKDDTGLVDPIENPMPVFQPMMCVHCEKAPCEPVCPVAATVHSHEGINQMIYNRCVGTRYCSNNCPYKVRRFNYLNYSDNQAQFALTVMDLSQKLHIPGPIHTPKEHGIELLRMLNNPDVTVRGRGVMEKCTYCTQRISQTRIEAKKQGRDIIDGEVITACQQACPTQSIVFGNIADKNSKVAKMKEDPRSYRVLEEEQTRPRTSYMGRITNPNPEIRS